MMKLKITKPDGTVVELEGLTADILTAVRELSPMVPMFVPSPWRIEPYPFAPTITWSVGQ